MMKLVISFDEIDPDFQEFCPAFPEDVISAEIMDFLENQFPMWDMLTAFPDPPDYDFDNREIHINMMIE